MNPAVLEEWRRAALDPPRAFGEPVAEGALRSTPEDFEVHEELPFQPAGHGAHWLLQVLKRDANTEWVARELARVAGVPMSDVGFAGLKDRHALVCQWFSVPQGAATAEDWRAVRREGFQVLDVHAHDRKLRRGALAANRFRIRVQRLCGSTRAIEARIALIRGRGVPNYFGAQRFGNAGGNLVRVQDWTASGRLSRARSERSYTISAARSLLFNAVLGERVAAGTWDTLLPGEVVNLDGSGSIFAAGEPTLELEERRARLDIHPTGPMWGAGEPSSAATVRALELEMGQRLQPVAKALGGVGLEQERRALRLRVQDLSAELTDAAMIVEFRLGPGAFATAVLRELLMTGES